jgi:hypothetical protein
VSTDAGDSGNEDAGTLPFTGSRTLPALALGMLTLLAGIGLLRAVRREA